MTKALSLLGICKKAGFLEIGEESVSAAARLKKARVIFSASDASDASKRHARGYGETYGVPVAEIPLTKTELAAVIGRGTPGMIAVTDAGLAFGIVSRLCEEDTEQYAQLAERLQTKAERVLKRRREAAVRDKQKKLGKQEQRPTEKTKSKRRV